MLKIFGTSDDILGRLAQYHAGQQRYEQARVIYRKFKDKVQFLRLMFLGIFFLTPYLFYHSVLLNAFLIV